MVLSVKMNIAECIKSSVDVNLMKNTKRGKILNFSQKEDGVYDMQYKNTKQSYIEWVYPLGAPTPKMKRYRIKS